MLVVFISSGCVLAALVAVKYMEYVTGAVVMRRLTRHSDYLLVYCAGRSMLALRSSYDTLRRDVFLRTVHTVTYVLLVLVRVLEDRLERFTALVRRARRGVRRRPPANLPGADGER